MDIKVTREQFESYVEVQNSGKTNMFAVDTVMALMDTSIMKEQIFYIMENYAELKKHFGGE